MRRLTFITGIFAVAALTLTLAAPSAEAQRRRGPARPGGYSRPAPSRVIYTRPYYRPFYYSRYYPSSYYWGWGYPWSPYGFYPGWWGGYGGWYGYGYGYGYGYPYRVRYNADTSAVRVEVKPRETQVYVDGYFAGVADDFDGVFQRLHLRAGEHDILLHLNGYRNASQKIYLQPGDTFKLTHRMEPLPSGAPQDPIPAPNPAAAARPDNRGPGDVRARPEPPEPGDRRTPPPQRPREPWPPRRPPSGEERPGSESRFGSVAIRVQPADAEILIDGQPWRGPADEDGAVVIQLSAGTHRIEIGREGFDRYETEIDVRPGSTTPVNVMLQRR